MKILLRVAIVLVVLVVVLLAAAAFLLPDLVASDAVRERIEAAAEGALDRDVAFGGLDFGLLPPSLLVENVSVAGATPKAAPLLAAERVALRIALLPLLTRTVVVDSLVVESAQVHLVRTKHGLELPGVKAGGADAGETGGAGADGGSPVDLAVAGVELRDCSVVVEDRAVVPPVTWEVRDLQVRVRGSSLDDPLDFDLGFELGSGGRIAAKGNATLAGVVDAEAELAGVVLASLKPYLPAGTKVAGTLSGAIVVSGPAANPSALRLDVELADGRIEQGDLSVIGTAGVVADLGGGLKTPSGTFDVDATRAEIRSGEAFVKPAGEAATVRGKIASAQDGTLAFDDVRLKLRNFEPTASARIGKRVEVHADAPAFEVAGWDALLPALAGYQLAGPVRIDELALKTAPMDLRGAIRFEGTRAVLPDAGPVQIDGALVGAGNAMKSENLTLTAAGEVIHVDATVSDLDGAIRYRVRTNAASADTNKLVSALSSKRDFIYGMLDFDGDLSGAVAGPRPPLESIDGRVRFNIDKGRMKGVSILQLAFDRMGSVASVAALASQVLGGPNLTPFYEDDFKEIRGTFDVQQGVVRTNDMRIVYRDYAVDLRGLLRLADLGVDMTGIITLGEKISATLGRKGGSGAQTISLARVTGTLDDPEVQVSPEVAMAFLGGSGASKKLDKVIDDTVGGEVGDLLKGVLGGGSRRQK
jgi:hypothetical protein